MSDESQGAADTPEDREPEEEARAADEVREDPDGSAEGPSEGDSAEGAEETPEGDEEDTRRPISVRDLMPSPSTRPARRPPERTERRERGRGEPEEAGVEEEEEESESPDAVAAEAVEEEAEAGETGEPAGAASVPTPVRVAMDAPPPGDSRPAEELPSRRFEVEGKEWIVRISGRTITGTRPDAGALLMHLSFFRPEQPEMPARQLVTVDRSLDAFYDEDLQELFERSLSTEAGSV